MNEHDVVVTPCVRCGCTNARREFKVSSVLFADRKVSDFTCPSAPGIQTVEVISSIEPFTQTQEVHSFVCANCGVAR